MTDHSPNLSLPYLLPSQAQKHVTHNEALRLLDSLVQLAVQQIGSTTPPSAPEPGEIHVPGTGATGAWAGQAGKLACYTDGDWSFLSPQDGWRAWNAQDGSMRVYSAGSWLHVVPPLQNLDGLGIGTGSDVVNRLAVASEAVLFSHAGADHRLTLNKATAGDTVSVVFQSGWSGRAEMGLTGDEDFHVRVSPDAGTWTSALRISSDTAMTVAHGLMSGSADVPNNSVLQLPTPSAGGIVAINLVDPLYPQAPHSGLFSYDTGLSQQLHTLALGSRMDNLDNLVLTGTTGRENYTSVASRSGELLLENRYGGARRYAWTFLNGY